MLGKTHVAIGTFTSFILLQPNAPQEYLPIGAFALIGSLMPDVDVEGSKINNNLSSWVLFGAIFIYLGKILQVVLLLALMLFSKNKFKHRTFTHSLLGFVIFSLTIGLLYFPGLLAFTIGYLMHLFADSLTISGIPILYPYKHTHYGYRIIKTGSSTDRAIGGLCILLLISFIFAI